MRQALEILAENRIAAAIADGDFEDLPGKGAPLRLVDDSMVPAEWRLAFRLLHSAGMAPAWIALGAQIRRDLTQARASLADVDGNDPCRPVAEARYAQQASDLNREIARHNVMAPGASVHLPTIDIAADLRRLRPGPAGEPPAPCPHA